MARGKAEQALGDEHGQRAGLAVALLDQRDQGPVRSQRGHRSGGARRGQAGAMRQSPRLGLGEGPDREGRRVNYSLHDEHVGQLMEQAMSHVEHLRLGLAEHTHRREAVPA